MGPDPASEAEPIATTGRVGRVKFQAAAIVAACVLLIGGCTSSEGEQRPSVGGGLSDRPELTVAMTRSTPGPGSVSVDSPTPTPSETTTPNASSAVVPSSVSAGDDRTTSVDDSDLKTFAGTQREYIDAFAGCIRSKGIPVDIAEDGTMTYPGLPSDQNMTLEQAQQQCIAEVGIIQTKNFTDEQLRTYYDLQHAQWKCLSDNGFSVQSAQTFQTYRGKAQQTGAPDWNVFSGIPDTEVGTGLAKCPNKIAG